MAPLNPRLSGENHFQKRSITMMTDWSVRMIKALQLNGLSERTQESYVRTVRMLTEHCKKTPESITEDELREYFLYRKNVSGWSSKTMRICYCGIRFFYTNILRHDWHIFNILRAQAEHRLPSILSEEEVRRILSCVNTPHNHAYLTTVYSCGLRLHEGHPICEASWSSDQVVRQSCAALF